MNRLEHDGRTTAYRRVERSGDGPTILFVHGSGGTHAAWGAQLAHLDAGELVALDLSGHGASDDVDVGPAAALDVYAADVGAVARETGATVLAGVSLGGATALTALLEGSVSARAVVLAGTCARFAVPGELRRSLATDFPAALSALHDPDRLFHDPDPRLVERSEAAMRTVGARVTRRDFRACHAFDVRDRLDDVPVPVLALTGAHDELTPPSCHAALARAVPDGEWTTVPDAAHLSMVERPEAFDRTVEAFLRRTP